MTSFELCDFTQQDADAVNRVALAAFEQYRDLYQNWELFARRIGSMAALSDSTDIIVAKHGGAVVGAVGYVAPGRPKAAYFEPQWAVLRMLVVDPPFRGLGIGRALTDECIRRAKRDGAELIALHTSTIMKVALSMYLRMGFRLDRNAPAIHGVPYGIYVKRLEE